MSKSEIIEILSKQIKELANSDCELTESTVMKQVGLNSIDFVKLLVFTEDAFDIIFEDDDLVISDSITLGDLAEKIEEYISEQN